MKRLLPLLLLAAATLLFSGCKHSVLFTPHGAYQPPVRIDEPLLVIAPAELLLASKQEKFGVMFVQDKYRIFYGQALYHEAEARFRPAFAGYAFLGAEDYALIMNDELGEEADRLAEAEADDEAIQRLYDLEFQPDFIRDGEGYLLRINRFDYLLSNGRPSIYFEADYIDRATGEVIDSYKMRSRGRETRQGQDAKLNTQRLRDNTVTAISQLLLELLNRMAEHHPTQ